MNYQEVLHSLFPPVDKFSLDKNAKVLYNQKMDNLARWIETTTVHENSQARFVSKGQIIDLPTKIIVTGFQLPKPVYSIENIISMIEWEIGLTYSPKDVYEALRVYGHTLVFTGRYDTAYCSTMNKGDNDDRDIYTTLYLT
jgi:hypothetical protein